MQSRHFLVQFFIQTIHSHLPILIFPDVDLRDRLVGEAVGHHETRVAGGAAEVDQPPLGEQINRAAVREGEAGHRAAGDGVVLDDFAGDAVHRLELGDLDFVVKVSDVADDRLVLHPAHLIGGDDILVAGGGDVNIRLG